MSSWDKGFDVGWVDLEESGETVEGGTVGRDISACSCSEGGVEGVGVWVGSHSGDGSVTGVLE